MRTCSFRSIMHLGIFITLLNPSAAQFRPENFFIKAAVGASNFPSAVSPSDTTLNLNTTNAYSGFEGGASFAYGFEYYFNKRFASELMVFMTGGQKRIMDMNIASTLLSGKWYARPNTKIWSPYVKATVGFARIGLVKEAINDSIEGRRLFNRNTPIAEIRDRKELNANSLCIGLGLGLDFRITRRFNIFIEYNYLFADDSEQSKVRNYFKLHNDNLYIENIAAGVKFRLFKPRPDDYLKVNFTIEDIDTQKPLGAGISIRDSIDNMEDLKYASEQGTQSRILGAENKYKISVGLAGYSTTNLTYNLFGFKGKKDEDVRITLFNKAKVYISVKDSSTNKPLNANVIVYKNNKLDSSIKVFSTDTMGRYFVLLPFDEKYKIVTYRKGTKRDSIRFNTPKYPEKRIFELHTKLHTRFVPYTFDAYDAQSGKAIAFDISLTNLTMEEEVIHPKIGRDGKYEVLLREGHQYKAVANGPKGYAYEYTIFEVPASDELTKKETISLQKLKFQIMSLQKGNTLLLRQILFKYNSNEVYEDSFDELERVVNLMRENSKMVIEIAAHTDNIGSESTNLKLSEKRAGYIVKYMVQKGIPKDRLVAKGYGKSKPLVANDTEENRAKNRRLELIVLKNE